MRVLASIGVAAALAWLDARALHDIVVREPNLALEYFTVVLSGLAFGGIAGYWVRWWRGRRDPVSGERVPTSQAVAETPGTRNSGQGTR